MLALAGETATNYGITGWADGAAIEAAAVGFAAWQSLRGMGKANSETAQIVESVFSFIERHGDSRFSDADLMDDQRGLIFVPSPDVLQIIEHHLASGLDNCKAGVIDKLVKYAREQAL